MALSQTELELVIWIVGMFFVVMFSGLLFLVSCDRRDDHKDSDD